MTRYISLVIDRWKFFICSAELCQGAGDSWHFLLSSPHLSDNDLDIYRSNVELNSTALSAVPGLMSSLYRHVILHGFMLVFPKLLLASGFFWTLNITDFLKKNKLDKSVGIHKNNLIR